MSSARRRSWTPWLGSYHPSLHPGLHAATATRQYAYTLLPPLALDGWRPLPQRLRPCPAPALAGSPMEMNEERKICKNKVEAESWFTGLSALICRGQHGSQVQHIDGIRIAGLPFDGARESSLSGSSTFTSDSFENKLSSVNSTKGSFFGRIYIFRKD